MLIYLGLRNEAPEPAATSSKAAAKAPA